MRRRTAGVTLLELLIAVSLFALLSAGILTAFRVGLNAMEKTNGRLMDNRRMAGAQRLIEQQIAGFMPVTAECMATGDGSRASIPFFQGEPQSMRFVTSYSLGDAGRGYPQILEYQVIPAEPGSGVRLIVNEQLYSGPRSAGMFCLGTAFDEALGMPTRRFPPVVAGQGSFVLADRLAFCRFFYREVRPRPEGERWVARWVAPIWPSAIRIEMAPIELDASRIQPLTVTAPIRVMRDPRIGYAD